MVERSERDGDKMKEYPVKGEKIIYLNDADFTERLNMYEGYPLWKCKVIGGYCFPGIKQIFIRESRRGDMKLLNHERGHLRGYKHTWYPTLMFPSWIGRFFNRYYPPYGGKKNV